LPKALRFSRHTCIASVKELVHTFVNISGDISTDMCPMWRHYYWHACHIEITADTFIREWCVTTGLVACMNGKPWMAELPTKGWQWQECVDNGNGDLVLVKRSTSVNALSVSRFTHVWGLTHPHEIWLSSDNMLFLWSENTWSIT